MGHGVQPLLHGPTTSPPSYLADALLSELGALRQPSASCSMICMRFPSESIHQFPIRLCQDLTDSLHLVVLTRERPAWPLGLWRARNWLSEFKAWGLCF